LRPPRHRTFTLAAIVAPLLALPLLVALAPLSVSSAGEVQNSRFIDRTNNSRHNHGLRSLAVASDLMTLAQHHAAAMARHHDDYHDPSLTSDVCCWQDVGENVGRGPSVKAIHYAFMHSSEHRSNILSRAYTQVGIGTARDSSGVLYVDEIFRRPRSASTSMQTASTTTHGHPPAAPVPPRAPSHAPPASRSAARVPAAPAVVAPTFTALLDTALRASVARRWRARDPISSALAFARLMTHVHHRA